MELVFLGVTLAQVGRALVCDTRRYGIVARRSPLRVLNAGVA